MKINICLATDENYFRFMATAILSILLSADSNDKLHFVILCNAISVRNKQFLREIVTRHSATLRFVDIDIKEFLEFPAGGPHISNTAYYRYKLAEVCPDLNKIIYLDCDTIIVKSLAALYSINLGTAFIGAVEDIGITAKRLFFSDALNEHWSRYNTGVLLINLNRWREAGLFEKFITYTRSHNVTMGDQEVINAVCATNIIDIPYVYNVQDSFFRWDTEVRANMHRKEIIKASLDPTILHYTYKFKPWNDFSVMRADAWFNFYKLLTNNEPDDELRNKILKFEMLQNILPTVRIRRFVWKMIRLTRKPRWMLGRYIRPALKEDYNKKLHFFCD